MIIKIYDAIRQRLQRKRPVLPIYQSIDEKKQQYASTITIDTEADFDKFYQQHNVGSYIYRGVNNASYKLYSSAQRAWLEKWGVIYRLKAQDFNDFIKRIINKARKNDIVEKYLKTNGASYTEVWLLAMMQHYGIPSPFMDFSHDLKSALFFTTDNARPNESSNLDGYMALYYINSNVDWIRSNIQNVMLDGADRLNNILAGYTETNIDTRNEEYNIRYLPYDDLKQLYLFVVEGGPQARTCISIPELNFTCQYDVINKRLSTQSGLFIANNTSNTPLAELMNKQWGRKYINCVHINTQLKEYIEKKYLLPDISKQTIYLKHIESENQLEASLKKDFGL